MKDVMTFTRAQAQDFLRARHLLTNKEFAVIEKCLWEKRIVAPKDLARALAMAIMAESGRRQRVVRKNPCHSNCPHTCEACAHFNRRGTPTDARCTIYPKVEKIHGWSTVQGWLYRYRGVNECSKWYSLSKWETELDKHFYGNPMTFGESADMGKMALEHFRDAKGHGSEVAQAFDLGVGSGLEEARAIMKKSELQNPMHPYEYYGRIEDYGGSYRIGPRSLGGIKKWAELHKFKVSDLEEVLKETRPGDKREWSNGPRRCIITKVFRQKYLGGYPQVKAQMDKAIEKNPKFVPFKPSFARASDYLRFLTDTFIPDLKDSGSAYELDFKTIASMLTSDKLHTSDLEYIDWLKTTLIPDCIEAGKESTAHGLQEGLYWIARGPGYGTRIQHKPKLGNAAGDPYKCDFAAEERKARGMTMDELNYALIDAMKATKGANPDKYYDQASVYRKELLRRERAGRKNPVEEKPIKGAKLIGTDCLAVEYMDIPKAKREGIKNPTTPWRHDFKVKGTKIWGLPDGRVLLDGPKPLWRSQPNSVTGK